MSRGEVPGQGLRDGYSDEAVLRVVPKGVEVDEDFPRSTVGSVGS